MSFEELLVLHASPTLAGMKCASLICLKNFDGQMSEAAEKLLEKGIMFLKLMGKNGCPLLLVYRMNKLEQALNDETAKKILSDLGYFGNLSNKLDRLKNRFLESSCPHEVGLFLGYPSHDVLSFIKNEGRGFICSGHWKVYHAEQEAKKTFRKFSICRQKYCFMLKNGIEISRLCVTTV